jgi:hypothetical protein
MGILELEFFDRAGDLDDLRAVKLHTGVMRCCRSSQYEEQRSGKQSSALQAIYKVHDVL